jgi:hypothetical protein
MPQIRFLQSTASQNPNYPFQAGQVIWLLRLTAEVRQWIADGRAEVIPDEPEAALAPDGELAVLPRARGRHVSSTRV